MGAFWRYLVPPAARSRAWGQVILGPLSPEYFQCLSEMLSFIYPNKWEMHRTLIFSVSYDHFKAFTIPTKTKHNLLSRLPQLELECNCSSCAGTTKAKTLKWERHTLLSLGQLDSCFQDSLIIQFHKSCMHRCAILFNDSFRHTRGIYTPTGLHPGEDIHRDLKLWLSSWIFIIARK